ncbi:MAG: pilus assembly protein, partial [Bifidobacterium sp.]
ALAQDAFDVVLHVDRMGGRRRITQIGRLEFAEDKLRGNLLFGWNGNQMLASQQWPDFVRAWSR